MKRASGAAARRPGHNHLAGVTVVAVVALVTALELPLMARLREAWFDAYQMASPRKIESLPAVIVEIDQKSLASRGQWPWPRILLAELVEKLAANRPAAIGIDILMPEPDALSPDRVLARIGKADPAFADALANRPTYDSILANAVRASRVVLVLAGTPDPTNTPLRATLISVRDPARQRSDSKAIAPGVVRYPGALTSIDELDDAAAGRGLISFEPDRGIVRRVPLVASVEGTLIPAFAIEMLRVAIGVSSLRLLASGTTVHGVAIGDVLAPTEADGAARIYFSKRDDRRFVSAIDVLDGKVDPAQLQQKLAVIALTGIGLLDYQSTALGERMPGSEIHAQLIENIYDHTLLERPRWGRFVEAMLVLALGLILVRATPRWKPQNAALLLLGCLLVPAAIGFAAFRAERIVLDALTPGLAMLLLFGVLLGLTLGETIRQKRTLQRVVQLQREQSARMAGELEAAKQIQLATLPRVDSVNSDPRLDVGVTMLPARETGGDLYDFFLLDQHRLFFLIGDVAGKGLSASIFMAVSKALYKSATLRTHGDDIGALMSIANTELSRDNPEMLFVTAFAGILDLESGELAYCNAGNENPYLLASSETPVRRITDGDGPPLCAVNDFNYHGGRERLRPNELVCIVTDGVTEAHDRSKRLFGSLRVQQALQRLTAHSTTAQSVVDGLLADVEAFSMGAELADDLTILALRWRGPSTPPAD